MLAVIPDPALDPSVGGEGGADGLESAGGGVVGVPPEVQFLAGGGGISVAGCSVGVPEPPTGKGEVVFVGGVLVEGGGGLVADTSGAVVFGVATAVG